jgi:hypothetical protein
MPPYLRSTNESFYKNSNLFGSRSTIQRLGSHKEYFIFLHGRLGIQKLTLPQLETIAI